MKETLVQCGYTSRQIRIRSFFRSNEKNISTSVPKSFTDSVLNAVFTEIGVDLEEEKEYYYVRVADKSCPDVSLSCKCTATGVGGLELRKARQDLSKQTGMHGEGSGPEIDAFY
ncbi:hypothetical protein C5167_023959 [Papaver somniferum]|uniref:DUF7903 domain-containing protein n=1 Tax=Papaver somniferum TaxID=3469 RepID=A0A4Y7JRA1_PAPSO|nr:hypothetical protein C5167_023959 [Papaver somniferum]